MKGVKEMSEQIIAIDAAIFAIAHIQNRGSTAYGWKDKKGQWHAMDWNHVIKLLLKLKFESEVLI